MAPSLQALHSKTLKPVGSPEPPGCAAEHQVVTTDTTNILIRSLSHKSGVPPSHKKPAAKPKLTPDAGRGSKRCGGFGS